MFDINMYVVSRSLARECKRADELLAVFDDLRYTCRSTGRYATVDLASSRDSYVATCRSIVP